jgi:ComF family protein
LCFDIGQLLGSYIKEFQFDVISFVPMHEKKEKKRGFNQAELIANGIAKKLEIPVVSLLKRTEHTETQTEKGVFERFMNMNNKFQCTRKEHPFNHVLLVDDVITTGATLAACAKELINEGINVSIACLAYRSIN